MKVRYVGQSFYPGDGLTNGTVYECIGVEGNDDLGIVLRIVDDSGEDYLYSATAPGPPDDPSIRGRWEIVEDTQSGELRKVIAA